MEKLTEHIQRASLLALAAAIVEGMTIEGTTVACPHGRPACSWVSQYEEPRAADEGQFQRHRLHPWPAGVTDDGRTGPPPPFFQGFVDDSRIPQRAYRERSVFVGLM